MKLKITTTIIFIIFSNYFFAQNYKISIKVNNLSNSEIYLGHHFGNNFFIDDTVKLDNKGNAIFNGEKKLEGGMYFILLGQGKYFDFLIDNAQVFSIKCDTVDFLNTVKFKNSFQNSKFYNYQNYLRNQYEKIANLREKQKLHIKNIDTLMIFEQQISITKNQIYLKKEEIVNQHQDSLLSAIIKSTIPIIPPPGEKDSTGKLIDTLYEFHYLKKHFFDNTDFNDTRLLRSSIISNKIYEYLNKLTAPSIDSVINSTDFILQKSMKDAKVYKYVISMLFDMYRRSRRITDENVFVYMAENYYLNGKTPWISDEFKEVLKNNIKLRKPNLIGTTAPEIEMKNNNGKIVKFNEIQNRHIIIYFYNTDCEICKTVTPEMNNFYKIIKDRGVSIIGIYTGDNKEEWKKYITDKNLDNWINVWDSKNKSKFRELFNINGTPVIFLLDEDRKILAKKITIEQLMNYFNSI